MVRIEVGLRKGGDPFMSDRKVKVLYIGGYSRSGSTLLLRFLGQMEDFVGVGEVWDIWRRSFAENQLCGCGQPFHECEFWRAVVNRAFGGFNQVNVKAMQALRQSVQSTRHIPLLALPALRLPAYRQRLKEYAGVLGQLYGGIDAVSGGKVIVDSSKVPPYAFLLNQVPNVDLHIVHLVRDSRATAFSWQRKKRRPEIHWKTAYMDRYSPVRSALEWDIMNGLFHVLQDGHAKIVRVRYEDLVQEPAAVMSRILASLGQVPSRLDFLSGNGVARLNVNHTVSGNPNRFEQGPIRIKPDIEWQTQMPAAHKALVTALTWPWLVGYGYLGSGRAAPGRRGAVAAPAERQAGLGAPQSNGAGPGSRLETSAANGGTGAYPAGLARLLDQPQPGPAAAAPLRVLMVTARYLPQIGGTEIHTFEVARRLAVAGHAVTVLTTSLGTRGISKEQAEGVEVVRVPAWPAGNDYYLAPAIFKFMKPGQWDLVHVQGYHTLVAPVAMMAAGRAGIPYVVTFHSGGHSSRLRNALRPVQRRLLRPWLARAAGLVAVSNWEAEFFSKHLRFPAERISVIPNGSYLPALAEASSPRGDSRLIVSVGRLERYKGHQRVIAALPRVVQSYPQIHLRVLGSGPYEASLRQLAHELGVADRVEIRPVSSKDREGMASVLMGAALVILLSDYESQGMAAMEALALGRPVVVADSTALRDLAASGLARAASLGSTPEEVAAVIVDQLRQPLIPANPRLPTWDTCASDLLALYHSAVEARPACAS
jgi:glycosyltransferase involved in cell wall biosynthesis